MPHCPPTQAHCIHLGSEHSLFLPTASYRRSMCSEGRAYGTGKRKEAIARVWLTPGTGEISVNKKLLAAYFPAVDWRQQVRAALGGRGTRRVASYKLAKQAGLPRTWRPDGRAPACTRASR